MITAQAIADFLLDLHGEAFAANVGRTKEALLAQVRRLVPFDAAIWGSGSETPRMMFGVASLDFPIDGIVDYACWQDQDVLRQAVASARGQALRHEDLGPVERHYASPIYSGFCSRWRIEHTLGAATIDPVTQVGELIFLFRSDRDRPFLDDARETLRLAMPHLVAAWRQRLIWEFARQARRGDALADGLNQGHAVVDGQGYIHASDAAFGLGMRRAFPGWAGPLLPDRLRSLLRPGSAAVRSNGHGFRLLRGDDRHVVKLTDGMTDPLSPAERRVAERFARGMTAAAVAADLGISRMTVRNHLSAIYAKLGLHSKAELARWVERGGG